MYRSMHVIPRHLGGKGQSLHLGDGLQYNKRIKIAEVDISRESTKHKSLLGVNN